MLVDCCLAVASGASAHQDVCLNSAPKRLSSVRSVRHLSFKGSRRATECRKKFEQEETAKDTSRNSGIANFLLCLLRQHQLHPCGNTGESLAISAFDFGSGPAGESNFRQVLTHLLTTHAPGACSRALCPTCTNTCRGRSFFRKSWHGWASITTNCCATCALDRCPALSLQQIRLLTG
jgi:hypothetical protein